MLKAIMNESHITFTKETLPATMSINPTIIWLVILVALLIFAIMSVIIIYHWVTYSYSPKTTSKAVLIYAIGSGILVLTTLASAGIYTLSL